MHLLNRRVRNRTHGGVGTEGVRPPPATRSSLYDESSQQYIANQLPNLFHDAGYDLPAPGYATYDCIYNRSLMTDSVITVTPIDGLWFAYEGVKSSS